ncbi:MULTISPECIES: hypothetical protein [Roseovarius]|uniref:hypothetical protein n=1 Tax=Roseovarius TaxID=74030 RepID=UPI00273D1A10|nr:MULTISPECIES: hypothetical protein [unclassified Roseovarius]
MIKLGNSKRIAMAGVTLGCALGIGYFMQLSSGDRNVPSAQASAIDTASADAFAQAFVGATPKPADTAQSPVTVPVEEKIGVTARAEEREAPVLAADAGKDELLQKAVLVTGQSFEADGLEVQSVTLTSAEPVPPAAAPQPKALPDAPLQLAALQDAPIRTFPKEEKAPALAACEGEIEMVARPDAAAMVQLELTAPCHADTQFTLHHNGMMFSAITDLDGTWSMQVPALTQSAVFIAAFDNGEGAVAQADVDMLDYYDRYVVQWQGRSGLQIHAMEYGANYGEQGHVWRDAARDVSSAATGEGGFLLRLGDGVIEETTLMAEVYTFPTQNALREGDIQVSLETEINAANCGRDIAAQALIKPGAGEISARDLTMAIPDCDAVGDFLVLKNLYEDLKIARN